MFLKLVARLSPGLVRWVARMTLRAVRESPTRMDDRIARELYDLAGDYRQLYEEINSESLISQPPDNQA